MVEAKILESLGYPMAPPLLFELNGRLADGFEEHFGQLHYWKHYTTALEPQQTSWSGKPLTPTKSWSGISFADRCSRSL
jgi:hypothetical protein